MEHSASSLFIEPIGSNYASIQTPQSVRTVYKLPPLPSDRQELIKQMIEIVHYKRQQTIEGNPHANFNIETPHNAYGSICFGHPDASAGFKFNCSVPMNYIPFDRVGEFIKVNPELWTTKTVERIRSFGDPYATLIVKGLYLGSVYHLNKDYLSYLGVNFIVSIIETDKLPTNLKEIVHAENTIQMYHIDIKDNDTLEQKEKLGLVLNKIVDELHQRIESGTTCFVHCQYGISRSSTIVAAYLIKYKNFTVQGAIDYLRSHRPQVSPKYYFVKLLEEYAKSLQ